MQPCERAGDVVAFDEALDHPGFADRVLVEQAAADGHDRTWTYRQIRSARDQVLATLAGLDLDPGTRVGLAAENSPEWVVADQALLHSDLVEVPVPTAFSAEQAESLIGHCAVCLVDPAGARRLREWGLAERIPHLLVGLDGGPAEVAAVPGAGDRITKVIHTSGTTGTPKGVMIRRSGLRAVIGSLRTLVAPGTFRRYVSLVPLSLLIEQIAGVYLPMAEGGRVVLLPPEVPLLGTRGSTAREVLDELWRARPSATVLPPALVALLAEQVRDGTLPLRAAGEETPFLMTGGAPVSPDALTLLLNAGLPVHEGYGLSENTSVVTWNPPGALRPGTAGPPLPHCEVRLSDEGELLVRSSSLLAGYVGEDPTSRAVDDQGWLHTGDRARIDDAGYVTVEGRMKNVIITSHGRNVSPEFVEGRMRSLTGVREAVVFGDGLEHLVALVLVDPADPGLPAELEDQARAAFSDTDLPDRFLPRADTAEFRSAYFTVTGRPRRDLLWSDVVLPALSHAEPITRH
ncbi:AMP-binding protein [Pseudonocardia sp. KRD291]|uniref:AMP-binding protein n=1 Tax=Pseudonocardia sp. KRD291 TaxID=2792007 RepID=UPI001C49F933|nr:AMP-binding protein [Pseudonocardia sp. KRD291]MBW0106566.1 AMP-binding protein [Pseudonocardia sp. KRD291]